MDNDLKVIYGVWIFVVVSFYITIQLIPLTSAAVVLGTNAGFVTEAPTSDPGGSSNSRDAAAIVIKDISPATAIKITEIGWWYDDLSESEEANFEVGLYAADGAVVPGEAGTLLYVERINAKGTASGVWKRVSVDWAIESSTNYWLALQLDDTTTSTRIDYGYGLGMDRIYPVETLPSSFGGGEIGESTRTFGLYAVWEEEVPVDTCSCPGLNQNWEIDHSDACLINDDCDLGTGTLSFTGAGITRINATIYTTNLGDPGTLGVLKILSDCLIWVI